MLHSNKEQIIQKLFKSYNITDVKILFKPFNGYSKFDINKNILFVSTLKKSLNNKEVLIKIILHEIDHILMSKKFTNKIFAQMYKKESSFKIAEGLHPHNDNKFEKQATDFSNKNFMRCINTLDE
jgi:hypothetical protein